MQHGITTPLHATQLVLASASPYRRALLEGVGVVATAKATEVDEGAIHAEAPRDLAVARAAAKALSGAAATPGALVIGGDQVLGCAGRAYDKARDVAEAREHLASLQGRTHTLHSAIALAHAAPGGAPRVVHEFVVDVAMPMRELTEAQLDAYLATGEWRGSVGCYKFEGRGALLFEPLTADQSAIIGLPLTPLFAALRRLGVDLLTAPVGPWTLDVQAR